MSYDKTASIDGNNNEEDEVLQSARLSAIENMFFLNLDETETEKYESENFKIERKKVLLDTILKNKKI